MIINGFFGSSNARRGNLIVPGSNRSEATSLTAGLGEKDVLRANEEVEAKDCK